MVSFSILHFSYVFAPCEMELKPVLPSLETFHSWIQENNDLDKSCGYRFAVRVGI